MDERTRTLAQSKVAALEARAEALGFHIHRYEARAAEARDELRTALTRRDDFLRMLEDE